MDDTGDRSPKDHERVVRPAALIPRLRELRRLMSDEGTRLLRRHGQDDWDREPAHDGPCNHGTFSPHPTAHKVRGSNGSAEAARTFGGVFEGNVNGETTGIVQRLFGNAMENGGVNGDGPGTTRWSANPQDIKHKKWMYVMRHDVKPMGIADQTGLTLSCMVIRTDT